MYKAQAFPSAKQPIPVASTRLTMKLVAEVVIVITVIILVGMFSAQRYGTDAVGAAFAPILIIWLIAIAGTPLPLTHNVGTQAPHLCRGGECTESQNAWQAGDTSYCLHDSGKFAPILCTL